MPELPEVETIVRELRSAVLGRRIAYLRVYLNKIVRPGPRLIARMMTGAEIKTVNRRGKFIVFELFRDGPDPDLYLIVHLKMTGQFLWRDRGEKDRAKHVHAVIGFEGGGELLYRDMRQFGYLHGLNPEEFKRWQKSQNLGPDPFQIDAREFAGRLRSRKGRIKPLLLNQCFLSGLGNIYVDEALFAAKIHPLTPAESLSEARAVELHRQIVRILSEAIELRGSTTSNYRGLSGRGGEFQHRHRVYRRYGETCPVCGCNIERTVVGGRGTHFCPGCQMVE